MEKLNLPVIKGEVPLSKSLSMDDYLKFVTLNLKYAVDIKIAREQKKLAMVNERFSI
jgi:hypothetical protein